MQIVFGYVFHLLTLILFHCTYRYIFYKLQYTQHYFNASHIQF